MASMVEWTQHLVKPYVTATRWRVQAIFWAADKFILLHQKHVIERYIHLLDIFVFVV